jgi:hypothetical protein
VRFHWFSLRVYLYSMCADEESVRIRRKIRRLRRKPRISRNTVTTSMILHTNLDPLLICKFSPNVQDSFDQAHKLEPRLLVLKLSAVISSSWLTVLQLLGSFSGNRRSTAWFHSERSRFCDCWNLTESLEVALAFSALTAEEAAPLLP